MTTGVLSEQSVNYAIECAKRYFIYRSLKFSRVQESILVENGKVKRTVTTEWRAARLSELVEGAQETDLTERVVPLWSMRRGQLLTDFHVSVRQASARILSRRSSTELTTALLFDAWRQVVDSACGGGLASALTPDHVQEARLLFKRFVSASTEPEATSLHLMLARPFREMKRQVQPGQHADFIARLQNFTAMAYYLRRRYLLWLVTGMKPGTVWHLKYSPFALAVPPDMENKLAAATSQTVRGLFEEGWFSGED